MIQESERKDSSSQFELFHPFTCAAAWCAGDYGNPAFLCRQPFFFLFSPLIQSSWRRPGRRRPVFSLPPPPFLPSSRCRQHDMPGGDRGPGFAFILQFFFFPLSSMACSASGQRVQRPAVHQAQVVGDCSLGSKLLSHFPFPLSACRLQTKNADQWPASTPFFVAEMLFFFPRDGGDLVDVVVLARRSSSLPSFPFAAVGRRGRMVSSTVTVVGHQPLGDLLLLAA